MKRLRIAFLLLLLLLLLSIVFLFPGCDISEDSECGKSENHGQINRYSVGDIVTLAGKEFSVYKTNSRTVMLLASQKIGTTSYHEIDQCINQYKQELSDANIKFEYVGLLDYKDLDDLGGNKHTVSISGIPYLCDNAPEFAQFDEGYWLGGYSKYDTYTWLYENKKILHIQFEDAEYAVRPVVHILLSDMS